MVGKEVEGVEPLFDVLDEKFDARIAAYTVQNPTDKEGKMGVSEGLAYIVAPFQIEVFDRLHDPILIGVERRYNGEDWFIIFDVADIMPLHMEMGSVGVSLPYKLQEYVLENIEESWFHEDGNNWMAVRAVNTGYLINRDRVVMRKLLTPLTGSRAHLLSASTYQYLVNKEGSYTVEVGRVKGYEVPAKIDISTLHRYHTGIFGYTGTGKSNLTSNLLRKIMDTVDDLVAVVLDITGEYPINIIDMLERYGAIYLDPSTPIDSFRETVVYPETLQQRMAEKGLDPKIVRDILMNIPTKKLYLEDDEVTIESVIGEINSVLRDADKLTLDGRVKLRELVRSLYEMDRRMDLKTFKENYEDMHRDVLETLREVANPLNQRSTVRIKLESLIALIQEPPEEVEKDYETIRKFARRILYNGEERLYLLYIPEDFLAREYIARLIDEIFLLKKTAGLGRKVLFVVDEAHEFISRESRGARNMDRSNLALEKLFRQGRKYGVGGWIVTQRVAHLNTSIMQQLHTYFVSTLPRTYDRSVVADAFSISKSIIDKVQAYDMGEWLFMSHVATKYKNIPVEVRTDNNEDYVLDWLLSKRA